MILDCLSVNVNVITQISVYLLKLPRNSYAISRLISKYFPLKIIHTDILVSVQEYENYFCQNVCHTKIHVETRFTKRVKSCPKHT